MADRTLLEDLKIQVSNYKAQRASTAEEISRLGVKMSEYSMRIMELENLIDKHEPKKPG